MQDHVDMVRHQWASERPDIDTTPFAIFGRFARIYAVLGKKLDENYKKFDLSAGDFDVLATLRRNGAPYALNPTQLYKSSMLSSGTMTSRIDRLEKKGLVSRHPDPEDRRALKIHLTQQGRDLIDAAMPAHVNLENKLLEAFTVEERKTLEDLLKKWGLSLGETAY